MMKQTQYIITLTNGAVNKDYTKWAFNEREAIILAQAEAIEECRGYDLVSIKSI